MGKTMSVSVSMGDVIWLNAAQAATLETDSWMYVVEDAGTGGGTTGHSAGDYFPKYHEAVIRRLSDEREYDPEGAVVRIAQGCSYCNNEVGPVEIWGRMKRVFEWVE